MAAVMLTNPFGRARPTDHDVVVLDGRGNEGVGRLRSDLRVDGDADVLKVILPAEDLVVALEERRHRKVEGSAFDVFRRIAKIARRPGARAELTMMDWSGGALHADAQEERWQH